MHVYWFHSLLIRVLLPDIVRRESAGAQVPERAEHGGKDRTEPVSNALAYMLCRLTFNREALGRTIEFSAIRKKTPKRKTGKWLKDYLAGRLLRRTPSTPSI